MHPLNYLAFKTQFQREGRDDNIMGSNITTMRIRSYVFKACICSLREDIDYF